MTETVDLYDSHYSQVEADAYRAVREEAFGEDLGQTSWITAAECSEFFRWLGLRSGQAVLEIACGSGGVSLRMAREFGSVTHSVCLMPISGPGSGSVDFTDDLLKINRG